MKFEIEICRTSYAFERFEVEAKSENEAGEIAMKMAHNTTFTETDAQYSIEETTYMGE